MTNAVESPTRIGTNGRQATHCCGAVKTAMVAMVTWALVSTSACGGDGNPAKAGADSGTPQSDSGAVDASPRVDGGAEEACSGPPPIAEPPERLYVAPDGSDSAAGTIDAPLRTLAEATSRFPQGGTVIVREGVYPHETGIEAVGTESHPLVIRAADGEQPIFDGAGVSGNWSAVIVLAVAEHVVIQGLEVRNCRAPNCDGIGAGSAVLDLTIRDTHIHHVEGSAARFPGRRIRLEDNYFHDVALTNENSTSQSGWPTCCGTAPDRFGNPSNPWADDVVIRGNRIEDCWGEGIGLWYASNAVVENNVVKNAYNVGIYADNAFNVRISRNFVHMQRGLSGNGGTGILLGVEIYPSWGIPTVRTHDVEISNNVIVAGGGLGWWHMSTPNGTYERVSIQHNTVVATVGSAFGFSGVEDGASAPSGCVVQNNVFAGGGGVANPSAFVVGGNAWLNRPVPGVGGATDVSLSVPIETIADPADAQALAPLVGTGESGSGITSDFLCAPRDEVAPTRGAFER